MKLFNPYPIIAESRQKSNLKLVQRSRTTTGAVDISLHHDLNRVRSAIGYIDSDDREMWVRIGMVLYHVFGDDGYTPWIEWSQKSDKFDEKEAKYQWDSFKNYNGDKVGLGTLFNLAKDGGWQFEPPLEEQQEITPLFDLEDAKIGLSWTTEEPPTRVDIFTDKLPKGKVALLTGPGSTGKTILSIQMGMSIATGIPLGGDGGWDVEEPGAVLCLFAEEDTAELHRRVYRVFNENEDYRNAIFDLHQNLYINSMTGMDNLMTIKGPNGEVVETNYLQQLIMVTEQIPNLSLIIIDPLSRFRGGDEIDNVAATRFVTAIEQLAKITGATVLLVHHVNKSSIRDSASAGQTASRGASALVDGVRWNANLFPMTEAEAKQFKIHKNERLNYVKLDVVKNNYTPPIGPTWFKRGNYGVLTCVKLEDGKQDEKHVRGQIVEYNTPQKLDQGLRWKSS